MSSKNVIPFIKMFTHIIHLRNSLIKSLTKKLLSLGKHNHDGFVSKLLLNESKTNIDYI